MINIPLTERLKEIANLVSSQSFFITLFVILILTISILIINVKVKSKAPKFIAAIVYIGIAILVLARYGYYVLILNDSVVEKLFKAFYFPNSVVYLSMLVISLLLMIANIIDKKFSLFAKIINFAAFFLIWFLFVLLVDTTKKAKLNFYNVKDLYSNPTVMILLQASMAIFAVWISVVIIDLIVRKVADKIDNKTKPNTIKNEDSIIKPLTKPIVETVEIPPVVESIPQTVIPPIEPPVAEPIDMTTYQDDTINQIIPSNDFNRIDAYSIVREDNINSTVQEESDEEEIEIL